MANEISLSRAISVSNGNYVDALPSALPRYDMNAIQKFDNVIALTTTEASLVFTGVTTPSLILMKNLDTSIVVIWGVLDGGAFREVGRLKGLAEAIFQAGSGITYQVKSASGTPSMRVVAWG